MECIGYVIHYHMATSLACRPQRPFLCIPPRSNIENDFIVLNQMRKMLQSTNSPERQINELTLDFWALVEISNTSIILGEENCCNFVPIFTQQRSYFSLSQYVGALLHVVPLALYCVKTTGLSRMETVQ